MWYPVIFVILGSILYFSIAGYFPLLGVYIGVGLISGCLFRIIGLLKDLNKK
ncbi:hypothetical protein V1503_19110 [Bacillus sp. SCS-151]|uniref:hypothetical protein n=1 Tax=Nanhaiella sioensis TaxID=3115293 RepID=UPI00397E6D93